MAALIDEHIPDGCGFTLFLFDYSVGGSMFYMSSAERAGSVQAIKEWIAREERKSNGH
jgi:hypothetical protein